SEWFQHGEADATRMMAGEWWRAVTALTLHADAPHLLGNALAGALLVTAVCQQLGPGVGLWLVLLAGAGGNALTAAVHGAGPVAARGRGRCGRVRRLASGVLKRDTLGVEFTLTPGAEAPDGGSRRCARRRGCRFR